MENTEDIACSSTNLDKGGSLLCWTTLQEFLCGCVVLNQLEYISLVIYIYNIQMNHTSEVKMTGMILGEGNAEK